MENESFSTILSHIYQDLVENFDLTNRLEKLKRFAADHPFITLFGIFTVILCSVPIACFFAFTLFSIFLTFGGFMFLEGSAYSISSLERYLMEQFQLLTRCSQAMSSDNPEQNLGTGFNESQAGTVLTFATIILGGVLILMGVLSILFSLSVALGLFVFHKSIDVFHRFHHQFHHAHNPQQQQQQQQQWQPRATPSAPPSQSDNANTLYPNLSTSPATSVPAETVASSSQTQSTVLTSTPVRPLPNDQANAENVQESNLPESPSNSQPDGTTENEVLGANENIETLTELADTVSVTPRSFVNDSNLRHRSPAVPDDVQQEVPHPSESTPDVMRSSQDSTDSNIIAANVQDNSDGLNWDTSSSSSSSLNPADQWEVLPSQAERPQDSENIH
ncbi:cell wall protein RBR3-like isoform X1 [Argonauta hians]